MDQESTWLFIYHAGETITIPANTIPGLDVWAIKRSFDEFLAGTGPELIAIDVPNIATGTIQLSKVTAMIIRPNGGDPSIKKVELLGAFEECQNHAPEQPAINQEGVTGENVPSEPENAPQTTTEAPVESSEAPVSEPQAQ